MKRLSISRLLQLVSLLLLVWLPTGCLVTDHRPLTSCRLVSSTEKNWTYTADGQIASASTPTGDSQHGPVSSDEYTYTSEGLLIDKLSRESMKPLTRHTYQYDQGRLVSDVEYRYDLNRTSSTQTFDYDINGNLRRIIYRFTGGALVYSYTYLFSNGKQTDYIYYNNSTGVESRPYRFENGFITQESSTIFPTVIDYSYDAAGRLTRADDRINGIVHVYEYTEGRPANSALPPFKGWPELALNATGLTSTSLLTRDTDFRKDGTGTLYKLSEQIRTYTQNEAGYPLSEKIEYRTYNPAGQLINQGVLSEKTYTYDNCPQGD